MEYYFILPGFLGVILFLSADTCVNLHWLFIPSRVSCLWAPTALQPRASGASGPVNKQVDTSNKISLAFCQSINPKRVWSYFRMPAIGTPIIDIWGLGQLKISPNLTSGWSTYWYICRRFCLFQRNVSEEFCKDVLKRLLSDMPAVASAVANFGTGSEKRMLFSCNISFIHSQFS